AYIKLEGISFYAHHGYYTHERTRGNNYLVDIGVETDIDKSAVYDDLHLTVNYESLYNICAEVMSHPCHLIETVAYRIAHEIQKSFPHLQSIEVVVHKIAPELGGPVQSAQVTYTLRREH
ncbi:MAG TPA: dihydroneopterin aldolase, partial [Saprospiraceae bacterium]|nr:dihydroneopterin aldolase [Saprospiraceae bacterium]